MESRPEFKYNKARRAFWVVLGYFGGFLRGEIGWVCWCVSSDLSGRAQQSKNCFLGSFQSILGQLPLHSRLGHNVLQLSWVALGSIAAVLEWVRLTGDNATQHICESNYTTARKGCQSAAHGKLALQWWHAFHFGPSVTDGYRDHECNQKPLIFSPAAFGRE